MTKREFMDLCLGLCVHFGRPEPPREQLASWYAEVGHLSPEAAGWMAGQIRRGEPRMPANLAHALLRLEDRWRAERPRTPVRPRERERPDCPDCRDGLLTASRAVPPGLPLAGTVYDYLFACARCGRADAALPVATREQLERAGYAVAPVRRE